MDGGGGGIGRALINGPTAGDRRRGVVSRVLPLRPSVQSVRVPGRRFGRSPSCVVRALSRAFRRWRFFKLATKRRRLGRSFDCEIMEMVAARVTYWAHLSPKPRVADEAKEAKEEEELSHGADDNDDDERTAAADRRRAACSAGRCRAR